ncbi:hypothetical protein HDU97_006987 [Phlyctochytrium planicorne]|nr:hypothetical protein HDU97_006987 [Phlyctochytrium planicorne]
MRGIRWAVILSVAVLLAGVLLTAMFFPFLRNFNRKPKDVNLIYASTSIKSCVGADPDTLDNEGFDSTDDCIAKRSGILVKLRPISFDFDTTILNIDVTPVAGQSYVNEVGMLLKDLKFEFGSDSKLFKKNTRLVPFTIKAATNVDYSKYPFEKFESVDVSMLAIDVKDDTLIPIIVFEDRLASLPSLSISPFTADSLLLSDATTNTAFEIDGTAINIEFSRNLITKTIVILSWGLLHLWAIMFSWIALQSFFRERAEFALMTWIASGILSASTIRNLQPSAPPVGTIADTVTYIWALIVAALGTFLVFLQVFRSYKPQNAKDKEMEKRDKQRRWRKLLVDEDVAKEEDRKAVQEMSVNPVGGRIVEVGQPVQQQYQQNGFATGAGAGVGRGKPTQQQVFGQAPSMGTYLQATTQPQYVQPQYVQPQYVQPGDQQQQYAGGNVYRR